MRSYLIPFVISAALAGCSRTGSAPVNGSDATAEVAGGDAADGSGDAQTADGSDGSDGADGNDGNDGLDGAPVETIVQCTAITPATPPGPEGCSVEKGSAALLLAGDVLGVDTVYEGGSVLVGTDGRIVCVGCDCAAEAADATKVICPDAVISPGLINAHDHIGWMNDKPWSAVAAGVDPAIRWEHRHDWRKGKRDNPKVSTGPGGASNDEKSFGELRFALGGGTALFGSGDLTGILRDLDDTGSKDSGLGKQGAEYNTFPLADSGGGYKTDACNYGEEEKTVTKPPSNQFVPHVSEGIDPEARNEFLCLTAQQTGGWDVLTDSSAIIHGVGLGAADVGFMASRGIGLVWSPRSNVALYGETARVTLMQLMGVQIGLGSDWIPSGSMNMLRELACADYLNTHHFGGFFSDGQLWRMATSGAAAAMGIEDVVGSLAKGFVADIAIFAKEGRSAHRAVVGGNVGATILVLRGGKVVTGNAPVVEAIEAGCDSLGDVCGHEKRACLSRDIGKSWTDLQSALGSPAYPLFFCDVPEGEPTCVPTRTLPGDSIEGSSLYGATLADDPDGDGISSATDNCPTIFNPIRPVDGGKQADYDADQEGDECDVCPLDADGTVCGKFDATDPDKDTVAGAADNCPKVPNLDQKDGDSDQKGDACDDCPDYANPGAAGCLADIVEVKTIDAFQGKMVAIENMVVTALGSNGLYCQKIADPPEDNSGVFVYTGGAPTQAIGDAVTIASAEVSNFFDQVQLTNATVQVVGSGQAVEALAVPAANLSALVQSGKDAIYEGMLVTVLGVTVTNAKPVGGAGDTDAVNEFEITGGVRVDDGIWPAEATFIEPKPVNGDTFGAITGVFAWRNGKLKLFPRSAADILYGGAALSSLEPATGAFQTVGKTGPTFPVPLRVVLNHASDEAIEVVISSDDTDVAKPTLETVIIAAGATSADVSITGVSAGTATITAEYSGKKYLADITVLAADAAATIVGLDPADSTMVIKTKQVFTVTLNIPAPEGGTEITVTVDASVGTGPETVTVPAESVFTTFEVIAAATAGNGKVTVTAGDSELSADVEVVELSTASLDISKYTIKQTDAAVTFTIPAGTVLQGGGYLVVSRDSDKAAFEQKWGVTLGSNVVFLNGKKAGKEFPSINGAEVFTLSDSAGAVVDGPTVAMDTAKKIYARVVPLGAPGTAASWLNGPATPGSGQATSATPNGVYISEFADLEGTGNFVYEYVELHFDGPKP